MSEKGKKQPTTFGRVVKYARENNGITRDKFSEKVGISPRYLAGLENDGLTPSYKTMVKIITSLGIDSNQIFYPDNLISVDEVEYIMRLIRQCDSYKLSVITATLEALLNNTI